MKAITGNSTSKKLITKFISGGRPVIFGASLLHVKVDLVEVLPCYK